MTNTSGVFPQMILGDPVIGLGSDSLRIAFGKYNAHQHSNVSGGNFLQAGARPGSAVHMLTIDGKEVFPLQTTVVSVTSDVLTLSAPAIHTVAKGLLIVGTNVRIDNCTIVAGDNTVSTNSQLGFLEAAQLNALAKVAITGVLPVQTATYPIAIKLGYSGFIQNLNLICPVGSCRAELFIDNTSKGFINAGSSLGSLNYQQTATSDTYFNGNSIINLVINNVLSSPVLAYTLQIVKVI